MSDAELIIQERHKKIRSKQIDSLRCLQTQPMEEQIQTLTTKIELDQHYFANRFDTESSIP